MKIIVLLFITYLTTLATIPTKIKMVDAKIKKEIICADSLKKEITHCKHEFIVIGHNQFDSLSRKYKFIDIKQNYSPIHKSKKSTDSYHKMNLGNVIKITLQDSVITEEFIQELEDSKLFEYIAIPHIMSIDIVPNDPRYNYQWSLNYKNNEYSTINAIASADLNMEAAWDIEQGDSSTVVAIIDTGVKMKHPDLAGRIWINDMEIPDNNIDDDNNGYIDDVHGWNFYANNNDIEDKHGHGTHVTGIVGANGNNGKNIAGMNWHCKIMPINICSDSGITNASIWSDGVKYAVDNVATVINMSLGGYVDDPGAITFVQEAITYAYENDVVVLTSSGNNGSGETNYYPAACDSLLAVGAIDDTAQRASFSNYTPKLDVVAPGKAIVSLKFSDTASYMVEERYGTSVATPHVAGLVSLIRGRNPDLDVSEIFELIRSTATDQIGPSEEDSPGHDNYFGYGLINPVKALSLVKDISDDSGSVSVLRNHVTAHNDNITIAPIPFVDSATISYNAESDSEIEIIIYTPTERIIFTQYENVEAGSNRFDLKNICKLPNGNYYVAIKSHGKFESVMRVVKVD